MNQKQLNQLPTWPQSQDSVSAQMADLRLIANRLGLYDAADAIKLLVNQLPELKFGCHYDYGENRTAHPGCVGEDAGAYTCSHFKPGMRKESCKYWRIIK